jgi:hypothetical protein
MRVAATMLVGAAGKVNQAYHRRRKAAGALAVKIPPKTEIEG